MQGGPSHLDTFAPKPNAPVEVRGENMRTIAEFTVPTAGSVPQGITAGPDGNIWFTDPGNNEIGMINPTTDAITEFPLPSTYQEPGMITVGPDGNITGTGIYGSGTAGSATFCLLGDAPVTGQLAVTQQPSNVTAGPAGAAEI